MVVMGVQVLQPVGGGPRQRVMARRFSGVCTLETEEPEKFSLLIAET